MSGKLSTHVLDTTSGRPAVGVAVELWYLGPAARAASPAGAAAANADAAQDAGAAAQPVVTEAEPIVTTRTNADGRTDSPLLSSGQMRTGRYRLVFTVGEYFAAQEHPDAGVFLDRVPIEFQIADAEAGYHVPLLVSPWAYSTYRGS